jgi:hypothetical protein
MDIEKIKISEEDVKILDRLSKHGTTKANRVYQLFQTVLLRMDFKDFIVKVRKKLQLPENGWPHGVSIKDKKINSYIDFIKYTAFQLQQRGVSDALIEASFLVDIYIAESGLSQLLKTSGSYASQLCRQIIKEYLVSGDVRVMDADIGYIEVLDNGCESDPEPEMAFYFPISATVTEMQRFIKDEVNHIAWLRKKTLGDAAMGRMSISKKFPKHVHVYNVYQELKSISPSERESIHGYLDIAVKKQLSIEGINISEGTIRSVVAAVGEKVNEVNEKVFALETIEHLAQKKLKQSKIPVADKPFPLF